MLYRLIKFVWSVVGRALWPTRVSDRQRLPRRGGAILAANHQSFCDSVFLPASTRRRVYFIAKDEYFRNPKTAWLFRALGHVPMDRAGGSSARDALQTAARLLLAGKVVAMYPEGTRTPGDAIYRGKTGVVRLAAMTGAPIVPVSIVGSNRVQPIGARIWRPRRTVTLAYGEPIAALAPGSSPAEYRAQTQQLMAQLASLSGLPLRDEDPPRRSTGRKDNDK